MTSLFTGKVGIHGVFEHEIFEVNSTACNFSHWMVYYPQCSLACRISAHPLLNFTNHSPKKLVATIGTTATTATSDTTDTSAQLNYQRTRAIASSGKHYLLVVSLTIRVWLSGKASVFVGYLIPYSASQLSSNCIL